MSKVPKQAPNSSGRETRGHEPAWICNSVCRGWGACSVQPASGSPAWMAGRPSTSGRDGHHGELAATTTLEGQAAAAFETSPGIGSATRMGVGPCSLGRRAVVQ
ncbi:hypothetical protein U9M48_006969 [Paspalum notatum var. saurae]|uniref:Uncharacterized protein n=1 Tax=Paspalum notatum var. saurae TaxID=547442 RepID=A0AAQ3Q0S0_PASNO